jgi:hypothetical protein
MSDHQPPPFEVVGVIRFRMPEDDVDLPLWDDDGLLPWETEILQAGLGVSRELIGDIKTWGVTWNAQPTAGRDRLVAEAGVLVERMRSELKDGLRVELEMR